MQFPVLVAFGNDAVNKMKAGADIVANAVKSTLGPKGRNVIIERKFSLPHITKDGVTVANSINLADRTENLGAQLIKEAARKTVSDAGDGTTTSTVLAQAMITEGLKSVQSGANPMDLKRGIDKAVDAVVEHLKKQSIPIKEDMGKLRMVATVSANNDASIGDLIGEAMEKIGRDGVITVTDSKDEKTHIEVIDGMEIERGYTHEAFVNTDRGTVEYDNPLVFICPERISEMNELMGICDIAIAQNRPILMIVDALEAGAEQVIVANRVQNRFKFAVIASPGFGDEKGRLLDDIAALTGATIISAKYGRSIKKFDKKYLGEGVARIRIDKNRTTIVAKPEMKQFIDMRAKDIANTIKSLDKDFEKEPYKRRLAALQNGIAVLHVGASSDVELKEKKDRIDDALHAVRAALKMGIIPGGGSAYIKALKEVEDGKIILKTENVDELSGFEIVAIALKSPVRQILSNGGISEESIVERIQEASSYIGYNARTEKMEDLVASGIVDPTLVAIHALQNAASVAGLFLTTSCAITLDMNEVEVVKK